MDRDSGLQRGGAQPSRKPGKEEEGGQRGRGVQISGDLGLGDPGHGGHMWCILACGVECPWGQGCGMRSGASGEQREESQSREEGFTRPLIPELGNLPLPSVSGGRRQDCEEGKSPPAPHFPNESLRERLALICKTHLWFSKMEGARPCQK